MKDFCVFVGLNKTYLDSLHLLLSSYIRNSGISDSDFFIFSYDIKKEDIKIDFDFTIIEVENKYNQLYSFAQGAPLRLDGIDYLKSKYKRGLYLDADIIVNGDLGALKKEFDEDICVVPDTHQDYETHKEKYNSYHEGELWAGDKKMIFSERYFNSGVMLISFQALSDYNFSEKYIAAGECESYPYHDQDFLNIYFQDKDIKYLPETYNAIKHQPIADEGLYTAIFSHKEKMSKSKIIHFAGEKPWIKRSDIPPLLVALEYPMDIFYRELRYIDNIISDEFRNNIKVMEDGIMGEVNTFLKKYNAYIKRKQERKNSR